MHLLILKPKTLTDNFGFYLDSEVLDHLEIGDIVRIGVKLEDTANTNEFYASDSPYLEIVRFNESGGEKEICGRVTDENRDEADNKYPVRCGEKIWFSPDDIFEIKTSDKKRFAAFLRKEHVKVTGKMYAFSDSEPESDSDVSED